MNVPNESKEETANDQTAGPRNVAPLAFSSAAIKARESRVSELLEDAWRKIQVATWVPKPLRFLLRRQDSYNRKVLDAITALAETQAELTATLDAISLALRSYEQDAAAATHEVQRFRAENEREKKERKRLARAVEELKDWQVSEGSSMRAQLTRYAAFFTDRSMPVESVGQPEETAASTRLDAFYVSFEDRFRGSRSDIKERLEFYLPFLAKAKVGSAERPILDLGCGRGEWLELLRDKELVASGADLNKAMVTQCQERGFHVTYADAIQHLRSFADGSVGAVTGFHIIEHLPFETLMDLLAEAWRVLAADGLVIFESPNCKNVLVGASRFYIDPTHRNPVFPETAKFMLTLTGFEGSEIVYLAPAEQSPFVTANSESAFLDEQFFGPQDFAVIARKGAESALARPLSSP